MERQVHEYAVETPTGSSTLYFDRDPGLHRVIRIAEENMRSRVHVSDVIPMFSSAKISQIFGEGDGNETLTSPISLLDIHGQEVGVLQAGMKVDLISHSMILCHPVE